jgi:hypothetical protein
MKKRNWLSDMGIMIFCSILYLVMVSIDTNNAYMLISVMALAELKIINNKISNVVLEPTEGDKDREEGT